MTFDPNRFKQSAFAAASSPQSQTGGGPAKAAPSSEPAPKETAPKAKAAPATTAATAATKAKPATESAAAPATPTPAPQPPAAEPTAEPRAELQVAPPPATTALTLGGLTLDTSEWEGEDDLGDMTELGTTIPAVFIAYERSKAVKDQGAQAGLWTHRGTLAQQAELDLVMLDVLKQRVLRPKFDARADEQLPPICMSVDGDTGSGSTDFDGDFEGKPMTLPNDDRHEGRFSIPPSQSCERCVYSKWTGKRRNRTKPACAETYAIVAYERTWGPVVIRVHGASIKHLRAHRDRWLPAVRRIAILFAQQHGVRLPAKLLGRFALSVQPEENYYVPAFGPVEPTDEALLAEVLQSKPLLDALREQLTSTDIFEEVDDFGAAEEPGDGEGDASFDPSGFGGDGDDAGFATSGFASGGRR